MIFIPILAMNCILFPLLFHVKHFSPALYYCQFIFPLLFTIYFLAKLSLLAAIPLLSFFQKQKILASFLSLFRQLGINHRNGHDDAAEDFPNSQRLSQKQPSPNRRINGGSGHEKGSKSILQSFLSIALHGKSHCPGHNTGIRNGKEGCFQTH